MYKLIFEKRSLNFLNKLENPIKQRIWNKLQECKEDLFRFIEHLEEIKGFKLRVEDYRIVIDIDNQNEILRILKIGHRKNIYD